MTDGSFEICEVVITAPDVEWLAGFVSELVSDRLCAAAHVMPIRTVYRWQGSMYDRAEGRVALHTRTDLVPQIVERTNRDHPYELPCVVAIPLAGGSQPYMDWVAAETRR